MGIKEVIALISLQFKNDKLITVTKVNENGDRHETTGTIRSISVDFSPRKSLVLLGIYIGVINAHLPELVFEFIKALTGG